MSDLQNDNLLEKGFEAFCIIKAAEERKGQWVLSGPVSASGEDFDGETLEKAGVMRGLDVHARLGAEVDYDHMYPKTHDLSWIIGKGIEHGECDGQPWLTTVLYKSKAMAQKAWEHFQAQQELAKAGFPAKFLGYSIYGKGVRDPRNPKRIIDTVINWVTIAPQPKGYSETALREGHMPGSLMAVAKALTADEQETDVPGTSPLWVPAPVTLVSFMDTVLAENTLAVKALTTGAGIVQAGQTGGAALRGQYLEGATESASFGDAEAKAKEKRKKKRRTKSDPVEKSLRTIFSERGVKNCAQLARAAAHKVAELRGSHAHTLAA